MHVQFMYNTKQGDNCECIATWRPLDVAPVVWLFLAQIYTAHAQKLLVLSFWSNFWHSTTKIFA